MFFFHITICYIVLLGYRQCQPHAFNKLYYLYTHQQMFVRWGNTISTPYTVANGVKQGGVVSPILFNIYMNKLSIALNSSGIGGYLVNVF